MNKFFNVPYHMVCDGTRLRNLKFIDFFLTSICFHSQEQRSKSTPSWFEQISSGSSLKHYSYMYQYGTKKMCLICDCNGNLILIKKPSSDRQCYFIKFCNKTLLC